MSTDFSSGAIPPFYRDLYNICTHDDTPIDRDIYDILLQHAHLNLDQSKRIWSLTGPAQGPITRTIFYKTLALIGWTQQGRQITEQLFVNCVGVLPTPNINLNELKLAIGQLNKWADPAVLGLNYADITRLDSISVELVPEKKGLFIKYTEYVINSRRFNAKVTRRYNDFFALQELLLNRFPYRMVPRLPPKKIVSDANFLEARRRGLHRWLTLVCRHPTICHDALVAFFLTDQGSDFQHRIREIFRRAPDEFMTSDYAAIAKTLLPTEIATDREYIRALVETVARLRGLVEDDAVRAGAEAHDTDEFAVQLRNLSCLHAERAFDDRWPDVRLGLASIADEMRHLANRADHHAHVERITVCERLGLLYDLLVSHRDLCERLEKGLAHDHQAALSKMLALKKRKIQGVIRGSDSESVEQLEAKMLTQENVITNMELRSDFSLYCIHMETQLVYVYLGTLTSILNSLISMKIRAHTELADVWKHIQPIANKHFPPESNVLNGKT